MVGLGVKMAMPYPHSLNCLQGNLCLHPRESDNLVLLPTTIMVITPIPPTPSQV